MELSTRNQLRGKVKSVTKGSVMAEVVVALDGGQDLVSVITKSSVERLGLKAGDSVTALVKATEVMIGK
jgi:molybdopterin-binding protein